MGCTTSCIGPSAAELSKSLKAGDERAMLHTLAACPKLLSSCTSVLCSTAITPLHVACENKQAKVVEQILSFLSCSTLEVVREALLPYCRRVGASLPNTITEGLRLAVGMANAKGQTPLMYACFSDCPELVELLLARGADPWAGDRCGNRTALHYAAMGGSVSCIKGLMRHIPPRLLARQNTRYVNARSCCGLTPLHYAVFFGHVEAIRELLHHDPNIVAATTSESYDVFVTCEVASSPLHFAAVRGNEAAARELLQYYAQRLNTGHPVPDPRVHSDSCRQLPWQVAIAHHPANMDLAALLHPGQNIHRALGVAGGSTSSPPGIGPLSLSAIAAASLRGKLLSQLHALEEDKRETIAAGAVADSTATRARDVSSAACSCAGGSDIARQHIRAGNGPADVHREHSRSPSSSEALSQSLLDTHDTGSSAACGGGDFHRPEGNLRLHRSPSGCTSAFTAAGLLRRPSCAASLLAASNRRTSDAEPMCVAPETASGSRAKVLVPQAQVSVDTQSSNSKAVVRGQDDEDEEGMCAVCFAAPQAVAPAGCGHGVCAECAAQLCQGLTRKPLLCPFCRGLVTGFVKYTAPRGTGVAE